jgi:hypothetical protein
LFFESAALCASATPSTFPVISLPFTPPFFHKRLSCSATNLLELLQHIRKVSRDDPYFAFSGTHQHIKLKKDYITGLGDTADFAIVGGRRDARDE